MSQERIQKELHKIKSSLSLVKVFVEALIKDGSHKERLIQDYYSRYENAIKKIEESIRKIDNA